MAHIVWNENNTIGIILNKTEHDEQMAYELRKGSLNTLGIVTDKFIEAWAEMTVDENCTIEYVGDIFA